MSTTTIGRTRTQIFTQTLLFKRFDLSQTDLGYLAGIIDGEGCISVSQNLGKRCVHKDARPKLVITNSNPLLMEWLVARLGGWVYELKQKEGWKPRYNWHASISIIRDLLPQVLPLLVLKRRQAELALELSKLRCPAGSSPGKWGGGQETPLWMRLERDRIAVEMHKLNKRGVQT